MALEIFNDLRVFMTGHTGFKGSWLTCWLSMLGSVITGYSLDPPTCPAMYDQIGARSLLAEDIRADIRDLSSLKSALELTRPELIIHMAAQPLVRYSYEYPVLTFDTNVMGTVNLLEAARNLSGLKAILLITTDKVYENSESGAPFVESDRLGGYDPYSSSKACAELAIASYKRSFFRDTPICTARAGNVIGGGDWSKDRLIPDCLNSILANQRVVLRNPDSIRPWQHVIEPLRGYIALCEKMLQGSLDGGAFNFGPDESDAITVAELANMLIKSMSGLEPNILGSGVHEAKYLRLDNSKAKHMLGWQPVIGVREAVNLTADWTNVFRAHGDLLAVTKAQLSQYGMPACESSMPN